MNKRILILFVLLVSVGILCGFETMRQSGAIEETALKLKSRGIEIPAVVNLPDGDQTALPLVVLVHGHGGSKDENIGFPAIAAELAKRGIASIRMDFSRLRRFDRRFYEKLHVEHERRRPIRDGIYD